MDRVKAAKEHTCIHCGTPIVKGEVYMQSDARSQVPGTFGTRVRMHTICVQSWKDGGRSREQGSNPKPVVDHSRTVIVERNVTLASRSSARGLLSTTVFVCRVEAETNSIACSQAISQALKYDLEEWNNNEKNLLKRKPTRDHYTVLTALLGYPSFIRPE